MKAIELSDGQKVLVDDEDYEYLKDFRWWFQLSGYAVRAKHFKPRTTIYMHKVIMGMVGAVDHINGNKLDNRKQNLRPVSTQQNTWNQRKRKGTTSQFKGVYYSQLTRCWVAQIKINYKAIYIGLFQNERAAAMAYDIAALDLYGEFAHTNFTPVINW